MIANTHHAVSLASLATLAVLYPPVSKISLATFLISLVFLIIGSLLPDIDQAQNRLWDILPGGDATAKLLTNLFSGHRNITHSFLGFYLIYLAAKYLIYQVFNPAFIDPQIIFATFLTGYVSHLLADSLTEEGLPLLFPIKYKFGFPPIRPWRIKTGKWFEKFIVFPLVIIYLLFILIKNRSQLSGLIQI